MGKQQHQHEDLNYLVVGLGLTGFSVASYLLELGYRCKVQDDRDIPPYLAQLRNRFPKVEIKKQALDTDLIEWADALVVSPGLSIQASQIRLAAEMGKRIIGDIELFAQAADKPVVAITGSNGKSTVTRLLGDMIECDGKQAGVGGNIGTPALDLLQTRVDLYVLELSSYQLETTYSLRPRVATVLNVSEDHLDRYPGYTDYIQAKLHIYQGARVCVSNADDETTRHDATDITFSLNPGVEADFGLIHDDGTWLAHRDEAWLNVDELKISGRHNWANCLAAMALAHETGISKPAIIEAMKQFPGIPHRSQWVAEADGVEWINDSKATNVGAAKASIEGRDRPIILIAGGQSKGAGMSVLRPVIEKRVKLVLLMGEDADIIERAWRGATRIERVDSMKCAVARAYAQAEPGDCVLLAPACASFDMYEKFEARGDDFMQQVRSLLDA
ncbi:MAG: UDP-N-acetylmuramoyl-L-alanine--D-glutamate ligase [Gammaproteobacteria bacterium]